MKIDREGLDSHRLYGSRSKTVQTGELTATETGKVGSERGHWKRASLAGNALVFYSTATARFYTGYAPAKKWVIVATIAHPQSRDFKRWAARREQALSQV